jgi:hypothetical protein
MSISSADAASLKALFRCPWASPCDKFAFKQKLMEASDEASVKFVFDTVRKDGHPFLQLGALYHNFDAWCTDEWLKYYSVAGCAKRTAALVASNKAAAAATKPRKPKPRPPSGFYGVSADSSRWRAQICYDSKSHYLGSFNTKQEAVLAYDTAATQRAADTGNYVQLNYDSDGKLDNSYLAYLTAESKAKEAKEAKKEKKQEKAEGAARKKAKIVAEPSGFRGVSAHGKRWQARVYYDSNGHYVGSFAPKQEAALAYDRAARQCGEVKLHSEGRRKRGAAPEITKILQSSFLRFGPLLFIFS